VIDDLLAARDDLGRLLDQALPALAARPGAEAAEVLAVLLVGPLRRTGPSDRMRRLVVRGLEARATPEATSVLEAIAAIGDPDTAGRAAAAVERLRERGVSGAIEGIGEIAIERGWSVPAPPPAEALAAVVRRPGEPGAGMLKLWLEPGEPGAAGLLAGGWTDPLDERRLEKERERFARMAGTAGAGEEPAGDPGELDAPQAIAALDRLVRRAGELELPLAEGVALVIAQLRLAAGSPEWPGFDIVAVPEPPKGSARPGRRRGGR
jgi:hypothetical protein